jgi:hypothetical protein
MQTTSLYHLMWERIFPRKWVLGLFLILLCTLIFEIAYYENYFHFPTGIH